MSAGRLLLLVLALGLAALAADRLLLAAEARGWLYYRARRGSSGSLGNAMLELHALLEPSRLHVVEERRQHRRGQVQTAGPPSADPDGEGSGGPRP